MNQFMMTLHMFVGIISWMVAGLYLFCIFGDVKQPDYWAWFVFLAVLGSINILLAAMDARKAGL